MGWQYSPYSFPLLFSSFVMLILGLYVWRRRPASGATPLALLMFAVSEWSFAYAMEFSTTGLIEIFWAKMEYVGACAVPLLWVVLSLEYTGREDWLSRRTLFLLALIPLFVLALVWAHPTLGYDKRQTCLSRATCTPIMMDYLSGQLYWWLNVIYSYSFLLLGTLILVATLMRSPDLYRGQIKTLLFAVLVPWLANILVLTGIFSLEPDLTPFAFSVSSLALAWAMFRYKLLDVMPTARATIVENMSDGVVVLDSDRQIVDLNSAAAQFLACEAAKSIGVHLKEVFPYYERIGVYLDSPTEQRVTVMDEDRYFDVQISTLQRSQQLIGHLLVLRDVTVWKQSEAEREGLIEELDAFAHTVAHDLKNPLSVFRIYVDLLKRSPDSHSKERRQRYFDTIDQTLYKMENLIEGLLLLARVRNIDDIEIEPLNMAGIVTAARERLADTIAEREAEITIHDKENWPHVFGYGPWLEEVWINYLSNALKYGAAEGAAPCIEIGAAIQADEMVRFWVQDRGPGILAEDQAQLFKLFSQLNPGQSPGHGLGLSIVRRIVEKLGGEVGVESELNQGCRFYFTLPGPDRPHK